MSLAPESSEPKRSLRLRLTAEGRQAVRNLLTMLPPLRHGWMARRLARLGNRISHT